MATWRGDGMAMPLGWLPSATGSSRVRLSSWGIGRERLVGCCGDLEVDVKVKGRVEGAHGDDIKRRSWSIVGGRRRSGEMRTKALLCRLGKLHTVSLLPQRAGVGRVVAGSGVRSELFGDVRADAACSSLQNGSMSLGSVRFMGIGSHKEGNRAGQHGAKYPQGKPDGSPEKAEADARKQFLEKAKEDSESSMEQAQEPFRDEVESGQSIGEASTELEFGVKDGKNTNEAISNASEQLFKQSTINAKSGEGPIKEEDKRQYPEHQKAGAPSEASAEMDEEGKTHSFLDDSDRVDLQGREDESVLGIGGQRAGESHTDEASASGETARDNIQKTRSEMRSGKARSPQAGVIVGNVPSAGANALENEDDIPEFAVEWEETGDETLDKAQKMYEQAISGSVTGGETRT